MVAMGIGFLGFGGLINRSPRGGWSFPGGW